MPVSNIPMIWRMAAIRLDLNPHGFFSFTEQNAEIDTTAIVLHRQYLSLNCFDARVLPFGHNNTVLGITAPHVVVLLSCNGGHLIIARFYWIVSTET